MHGCVSKVTAASQSMCILFHDVLVAVIPCHPIVYQSTWPIPPPPAHSPIGLILLHSICELL